MPDMNPEDIKAAIRKAGTTMSALAAATGVARTTLSMALHARVSAKAEQVIGDFLKLHPMKIWPSRYDKTGRRLTLVEMRMAA